MTLVFSYKSIVKSYGDKPVFDDLTINIQDNERLGLIGGNGSGKSTLLELMADRDTPEQGERYLNKGTRLVLLSQQDELDPEKTIHETLDEGLAANNINGQERYRKIQQMIGLGGFDDPSKPCSTLSGGWQKRLAITRALSLEPGLFLLDEPTNHLDLSGILWLESILKNPSFAFVVVSHDRAFLESVCTDITELGRCYPQGAISVRGGYTTFERERTRILTTQLKQEEVLANRMRRETEWLRQGAKARSTKARYRIDQADRLDNELSDIRHRNRQTVRMELDFNATDRKTRRLLTCQGVEKSLGGKQLFKDMTLALTPGTRLGLVGDNGSGKTSFMNILGGSLDPDRGRVDRADQLKIAVFDQNRTRLDPELTLKQALSPAGDAVVYQGRSIHVVSWAKRFLFTPDQLTLPVSRLSGGEKARVLMAEIMLTPADLLLLDEPTNDLDIPSLEVLEQGLMEFPGAIVLVTHDRFLLNRVATSILYFDGKGSATPHADISQCLTEKDAPRKKQKSNRAAPKKKPAGPLRFSYKDKFELEQMESRILTAEKKVADLERSMEEPSVISNPDKLASVCTDLQKAHTLVEELYARWEELEALKAL